MEPEIERGIREDVGEQAVVDALGGLTDWRADGYHAPRWDTAQNFSEYMSRPPLRLTVERGELNGEKVKKIKVLGRGAPLKGEQ